tara:strand:+ start:239 stop:628 length:390 start_codon:yes stop_codon:yes gene_type:complete
VSSKTDELVEQLSELTVLEMSELKEKLEEKWGVKAAAMGPAVMAVAPGAPAEEAEEATDFSITLDAIDASKKIAVIKIVREITGLGLKEAKEVVENTPKVLKESAPKAEAEEIKKKLEEAACKVTLKGV